MSKRVEYGPTIAHRTPDGRRVFITPVAGPRGGFHVETRDTNPHRTLTQRLRIDPTRYDVTLVDARDEQTDIRGYNPNKTTVWSRTRRHATNDGLKTILHQRVTNRNRASTKS